MTNAAFSACVTMMGSVMTAKWMKSIATMKKKMKKTSFDRANDRVQGNRDHPIGDASPLDLLALDPCDPSGAVDSDTLSRQLFDPRVRTKLYKFILMFKNLKLIGEKTEKNIFQSFVLQHSQVKVIYGKHNV